MSPRGESRYDTAQVCLNGHVITTRADDMPNTRQDFCGRCGEAAIMACQDCSVRIRGLFLSPMDRELERLYPSKPAAQPTGPPPAYCHSCGEPYPWTQRSLEAAEELIELEEDLSPDDKQSLKNDLPDLVTDTPRTKVAVAKMKQFLQNAAPWLAEQMRELLVDVISETAKKALFPDR